MERPFISEITLRPACLECQLGRRGSIERSRVEFGMAAESNFKLGSRSCRCAEQVSKNILRFRLEVHTNARSHGEGPGRNHKGHKGALRKLKSKCTDI